MSKLKLLAATCSVTALLTGCMGSTSDLEQWVQAQEGAYAPQKIPLDPPLQFKPYAYNEAGLLLVNPFDTGKMIAEIKGGVAGIPAWIQEELDRVREPLEEHPIETIFMVGTMQKNNRLVALIKVGDLLYPVEVGAYLGQNLGKILSITETTIDVRELVPQAQDEWGERLVTLRLQEGQP